MKQALSILLVLFLMAGCSANASPENKETSKESETQSANEKKNEEKQKQTGEYQPNPQVTDDRSLQKVGQTYKDRKGEATLKSIKKVNKTYKVGPVEVTVKEMKLIHLRPDYSMIDYFHVLTHAEEFDFVKVFVEVKNTSSEKVNFAPIALLKTSSGETFTWEKDIYLEELNGELKGNATKAGNLGFIVNAEKAHEGNKKEGADHDHKEEDIKWVEITTSDVFDQNEKKIADSQKIKIEF
ncbi:hypothetical protein JOC86_001874 [Bacillus pakistanensis]|uniref:DUF4352 domain-containing protein n=1 Tax=Rossellomorea pakistanensis TaxID=992288 RepID=A0ABS2NBU3_9BACI|nr:hypothetical protein [Bacillus pakistanensis]MBM7585332.1 hypothetical protein [Bacillus pakistanensis]